MSKIKIDKVVSSLPSVLIEDTIYAVRVGVGFDIYFTDSTGSIAHVLNAVKSLDDLEDVNISLISNNKQVLKNDGTGNYTNETLELDDLDDVNTTALTPQIGWVLKHNGTEFVPVMRQVYRAQNLIVNTQTNFGNGTIMQPLINFQRQGTYSFTFFCNYSIDATNSDIVMEAQINGALSNIANSEILRLEGKDAGGNNFDGRGTSQKYAFSQKFYKEFNLTGDLQLLWRVQPEANNVEASVWEATLIVEEEFGIIEL